MMRIGRSEDNTGSLRHGVEPRHGKGLTPAIALLDHGDGREYLPRRHGRPSLAAHRSKKIDRKSTRLNSSHSQISYAVFCLKKKIKSYPADTTIEELH